MVLMAGRHAMGIQKTLDADLHTGASDTVSNVMAAVGPVINTGCGNKLVLKLHYEKGSEEGMALFCLFPATAAGTGATIDSHFVDIGGGIMLDPGSYIQYQFKAEADKDVVIELHGREYVQVFQQVVGGVAPDGIFTLKAQIYS
jgi:hypothetical protein